MSGGGVVSSGGVEERDEKLQGLAVRLLQLLCSCWLECSPGQLITAPELELVQVCVFVIVQIKIIERKRGTAANCV